MKILFMGTPDFAEESLKALYEAKYDIIGVVTNVDKPKGRGMKITASPVKEYALEKNLKVYQPEKVRNNPEFLEEVKQLNPDIICVVAYGKILPQELLSIPKYGCINVHGSLLPQYRGAAPIQWAVLNGDSKTGVTTMFMDVGMDTGDMILKKETEIGKDETTGELWDRLKVIGADLLVGTVKKIDEVKGKENISFEELKQKVGAEKQGENFTMAPMLSKEMAKIDWENKNADEIKNLVRGLNPIMGAYTYLNGKKIKFWKVQALSEKELFEKFEELKEYKDHFKGVTAGAVLFSDEKTGLFIKANKGILQVLEIQGENSKRMSIGDFLRGNKIEAGSLFE